MRYFIPTTRGLEMTEDDKIQCYVAWYHEGEWYNEFEGSEEECEQYLRTVKDKENYQLRYEEFD